MTYHTTSISSSNCERLRVMPMSQPKSDYLSNCLIRT